jgi:hypothetical protein
MTTTLKSIPTWCLLAGCLTLAGAPALAEDGDDCAALDAASLDTPLLATIGAGLAAANADFATNGETGAYAVAAKYERDYLVAAKEKVKYLQDWMAENELDATNASTAASVSASMRQAIGSLQEASWWALISAVYHKSADARTVFEKVTEATDLANALSKRGGRCYMRQYLPE